MTTSDESTNNVLDLAEQKASRTGLPEPQITTEDLELIRQAEHDFERMCEDRHRAGQTKYGSFTFLEMPTIEMGLEELADMANYIRYTAIKLALLRKNIARLQQHSLGQTEGFFTMEQVLGITKEIK